MTLSVLRTSKGCSSDEVVLVLQKMLDKLYMPDERGNFAASTLEGARNILLNTQPSVYGFMKNLVNQLEEDDALAMLVLLLGSGIVSGFIHELPYLGELLTKAAGIVMGGAL